MTKQNEMMSILDPAAMKRLREMVGEDDAFLAELMDTFLEDAPRLLEDMRQSVKQEDAAALCLAAHSLKSNSTDFGATVLAGLCRELETMGKTDALNGAAEKITQAQVEYAQVQVAIETTLRALRSQDE